MSPEENHAHCMQVNLPSPKRHGNRANAYFCNSLFVSLTASSQLTDIPDDTLLD